MHALLPREEEGYLAGQPFIKDGETEEDAMQVM